MSKHTPGPWHVTWLANMDHRNCKSREAHFAEMVDHDKAGLEDDTDICSFSSEITEEQAANARLIAAAPELYAAAKAWAERGWCASPKPPKGCTCDWHMARAAIAKAEGRS